MQFGWVNMRAYNSFVSGPKFTIFFLPNVGGIVVDQLRFRFSTGGSIREIFAIKFESCLKSRPILPSQILGGRPSAKIVPSWTPLPSGTSRGKVLVTLLPLVVELKARTPWILSQIWHVGPQIFWGDPRPRLGCALASLDESLVRVKIWGASTP